MEGAKGVSELLAEAVAKLRTISDLGGGDDATVDEVIEMLEYDPRLAALKSE